MDFSPELYETLRRYSEADEPINVTVINQFQQEFTISGTMPIFHHTRDMGYECSGVHLHYIILNFDKNDSRATIKLFCPSDTTATEVHPLTIKKITKAIIIKLIISVIKAPYFNDNVPMFSSNPEKSTLLKHPSKGEIMLSVNDFTNP